MYFKAKFIIVLIFLIYIFSLNVYASENIWEIHFLAFNNKGESYWVAQEISFSYYICKEEKTKYAFNRLFKMNNYKNAYNFPKDIEVYDVIFKDDLLILNVSNEILNYSYGSYYEVMLKSQIVKTALNINNVNKVTLLIEGDVKPLKKGLLIYQVPKC